MRTRICEMVDFTPVFVDVSSSRFATITGKWSPSVAECLKRVPNRRNTSIHQTPLFTKGRVLYGLDKSKRALIEANSAIVCEGQLDLISAFEAGIQNVIAPQGTAFTSEQARLLRRFVESVVLCFDSDQAEQRPSADQSRLSWKLGSMSESPHFRRERIPTLLFARAARSVSGKSSPMLRFLITRWRVPRKRARLTRRVENRPRRAALDPLLRS